MPKDWSKSLLPLYQSQLGLRRKVKGTKRSDMSCSRAVPKLSAQTWRVKIYSLWLALINTQLAILGQESQFSINGNYAWLEEVEEYYTGLNDISPVHLSSSAFSVREGEQGGRGKGEQFPLQDCRGPNSSLAFLTSAV